MTAVWRRAAAGVALLLAAAGGMLWLDGFGEAAPSAAPSAAAPGAVERGAVLATLGHCAGCHTAPGGPPYAGGRAIATPYGTVYGGNLTPDPATGLGLWNADHFWRALHHGRSRDGRRLNPAFPYPFLTRVTRADSDALWAYLRSLPPVVQPARPAAMRWPYGTQAALIVWRTLFFRAGEFRPDAAQSAAWNRGAYLVEGLAHCGACHGARNALGAAAGLGGETLPDGRWWAPSLHDPAQAGLQDWPAPHIVALLRDGRARDAVTLGPMALVVAGSLQHWPAADLQAMATYLKALPRAAAPAPQGADAADPATLQAGAKLYEEHCADCHREVPPDRRTLLMSPPNNLVRAIIEGGFGPSTAGHPQPHGMPPFGHRLDDAQIAAIATWLRQAAGAPPVSALQVWQAGNR